MILDNLHWADNASLLLLEFLSQELIGSRILLMGTYRDADLSRRHPLSQILGELTKDRLFKGFCYGVWLRKTLVDLSS
jgi:predicted ATPase